MGNQGSQKGFFTHLHPNLTFLYVHDNAKKSGKSGYNMRDWGNVESSEEKAFALWLLSVKTHRRSY